MPGQLFTQYFLTDGIRATPERRAQAPAFATFRNAARRLFQDFANSPNPNETQTEQDLIRPLLQLLGWTDDLPQQTSSGGEDIPDLLLFVDPQAKTRASSSKASPYLEALAVAELKRFRRHLRARLDAHSFHLYGLSRDADAYILSTFPIIQRQDQAQFGHFRTKALILAYMNALAAGDTPSRMAL